MRILIATPLFPPDVTDPAPYVKELAACLSEMHEVRVLAYGNIPESIPEVVITTVEKSQPLLWRLWTFTRLLYRETRSAERVLIINGPSTELPSFCTGLIYKKKLTLLLADKKIRYRGLIQLLHALAIWRTRGVIDEAGPTPKPEVHPFKDPVPGEAAEYMNSWKTHLELLNQHFNRD